MIPYFVDEDSTILYMFMKPSDPAFGGDDWQIAKGRFDEDETDSHIVAIREGREELGLIEDNVEHYTFIGEFRKMYVWSCKVTSREHFSEYDYETGEVCWLSNDEFQAFGRDIHKDIVEATESLIKQTLSHLP